MTVPSIIPAQWSHHESKRFPQNYKTWLVQTSVDLPLAHLERGRPWTAFVAANPAFDPTQPSAVRFVFDRTASGVVVLDDVGFSEKR